MVTEVREHARAQYASRSRVNVRLLRLGCGTEHCRSRTLMFVAVMEIGIVRVLVHNPRVTV